MTDGRQRRDLPTGTVTFLRTDVEGSMRLAQALGSRWDALNVDHLEIIRRVVGAHGGACVRTEGDAFFGVFPEAGAAVSAAIEGQRELSAHPWPPDGQVRVRMALHTGEAHLAGDDYGGFEVNRAARIAAVGHGGQIVLSAPTRALVESALPAGAGIHDLGRHRLRDVPRPEQLFQLDVPGLRNEFPPLRTSLPAIGDLPSRMTSFIGRDPELEELGGLLTNGRLVTLTGPGGIGKTSLAVELARAHADRFVDGAWFVALASVGDASLVPSVIARTLGLFDGPERPAAEGLTPYLADRSVLLILDNFERLLDASGDVAAMLDASPASRVIVTSRAPIRIAGEQEYPVRSLRDASPRLFVERAHAVRPDWDPEPDADVVDQVCTLLDGLPLGIELAAARVSFLPVTAIRDRLAARLPLPGSGPRNVPDRQRTLEGAFAWSHDLLAPDLQRVLHDAAVFEGGFDLEQAASVVEASPGGTDLLDDLVTLLEQSLVTRDIEDASGTGIRFRLLTTIRGFALERLRAEDREADVRRRHATAYLALAEQAAAHLPGADQPRWLDRLALDHPNLRSAIRWSLDAGEVDVALRFVAAMWRFWQLDGHLSEGNDLAEAALAMPGAEAPTAARLAAITAAGGIAYYTGRPVEAIRLYQEELDLARRLNDRAAVADATWNLAYGRFIDGDNAGGERSLNEALEQFRAIGDERGAARVEWTRGVVALSTGRPVEALAIFEASVARFEELGDAWYHAMATGGVALCELSLGDIQAGSREFVRGLMESHALRDVSGTSILLDLGAMLSPWSDRPEDAAALLAAGGHLRELYGIEPPAGLERLIAQYVPRAQVRERLDPERLAQATERGRRMSLDDAVALIVRIQDEAEGRLAPGA